MATRIYQPGPISVGESLRLTADATHHLKQVMRIRLQDEVILFNGAGGESLTVIHDIQKREITVKVISFSDRECESPVFLHLGQVISRGDKMDFTIQKAVELGVSAITPLFSERCGVKLTDDRLQKRMQHWQAIIIHACEQSGRNRLPLLHPAISLKQWLTEPKNGFVLNPHHGVTVKSTSLTSKQLTLLLGSEGGLSESEIAAAEKCGLQSLRLGPRILRTETAGLTALAILQAQWGDLG